MAQQLSIREEEVLEHVAHGQSTKEIASDLEISQSTVNWHVGNVLSKLGASSRAEAVALRLREDADQPGSSDVVSPSATIAVAHHEIRRWRRRALAFGAALVVVVIGGMPLAVARHGDALAEPTATPHATTPPEPTSTNVPAPFLPRSRLP
jgi:DNA-binding CsgD family transcriptional regulator